MRDKKAGASQAVVLLQFVSIVLRQATRQPAELAKAIACGSGCTTGSTFDTAPFHQRAAHSQQPVKDTIDMHSSRATAVGRATAAEEVSACPSAAELYSDAVSGAALTSDLSATAMSIDTPSYARSMGMGQNDFAVGFPAGFSPASLSSSQNLAQAMSIDGVKQMPFWDNAAPAAYGERAVPLFLFSSISLALFVCFSPSVLF